MSFQKFLINYYNSENFLAWIVMTSKRNAEFKSEVSTDVKPPKKKFNCHYFSFFF